MHGVSSRNQFFLQASKIQITDSFEFISIPKWRNASFLHEKYVKEGRSPAQIAAETFSCRSNITEQLKLRGIVLRNGDKPKVKTISQLKYGERIWRKKLSKDRKERSVLNTIGKLHARHYSYHQIAHFLNDSGIPTKTGRGKWHARFVQKLLHRGKR